MPIEQAQWYTLSATINGRVSCYGCGGKRSVTHTTSNGAKIVVEFKKSLESTNETDLNRGQIPELFFSVEL